MDEPSDAHATASEQASATEDSVPTDADRSAARPDPSAEPGHAKGASATADRGAVGPSLSWAPSALLVTGVVGLLAKLAGVIVKPGLRGVATQRVVESAELTASALAYVFAALLVALICTGSFELARARKVALLARTSIVAASGLVIAVTSPALIDRLHVFGTLASAVVTSSLSLVASVVALRASRTRAVGGTLLLFTLSALARPSSWALLALAGDRASMSLYEVGRAFGIGAVVLETIAVVIAATWLATRSRIRGRLLVNLAFVIAFVGTYAIAHEAEAPSSAIVAVLRGSALRAAGMDFAFQAAPVSAFLGFASVLLAGVALLQPTRKNTIPLTLALALLSGGAFDVPLQALAITVAAQWLVLAKVDVRAMWAELQSQRAP